MNKYFYARVLTEPLFLKKTPLYSEHVKCGGKLVGFGGWEMPVQYTGIIDEHKTVRDAVGMFDISHMGQLLACGTGAKDWLNSILSNNVDRIDEGECQYTFLLNDEGGIIDDLIVYHYGPEEFLLVVNASMTEKDVAWMEQHLIEGVTLENRSAEFAGLAIQGPHAIKLYDLFFSQTHSMPARNEVKRITFEKIDFLISRTGYTGEDGFEIFFPAEFAVQVWNEILDKGKQFGIKPCGLGARDTLRLEMCYPLNGSDLTPSHTPLEAGLSIFVDLEKKFIGRDALVKQRASGVSRRLVPFKMTEKSPPPRSHYPLFKDGKQIAEISSGTLSPSLNTGVGMAYVPSEFARINEQIEVDIRGKRFSATIERKPLHKIK